VCVYSILKNCCFYLPLFYPEFARGQMPVSVAKRYTLYRLTPGSDFLVDLHALFGALVFCGGQVSSLVVDAGSHGAGTHLLKVGPSARIWGEVCKNHHL